MTRNLLVISISAAILNSCIIAPKNIVPDMPHNASWRQRAQQEAMAAHPYTTTQAKAPMPQPTTTAPTPAIAAATVPTAPAPAATPKPAVTPKSATTPTATAPVKPAGNHITAPVASVTKPVATIPQPTVAPTPAPVVAAPVPVSKPLTKQDLKNITNEGQDIPFAKRVPGDPTRVYNPLAPELTIRTIDRTTGKPLPRGTILKVNGTEFKFKVP